MIPLVLALGLGLIAIGGLAWMVAPLLGRSDPPTWSLGESARSETTPLLRALDLLDDLDTERARGALSESEHKSITSELRREAAGHLKAQDEHDRKLDSIIETWITGRDAELARTQTPQRTAVARHHSRLWLLPSVPLVGLLVALILVVTVGTRGAAGTQTVVGVIGIKGITAIAAAPYDPDVLVVAHPDGVQWSADAGTSWTRALLNQPIVSVSAADQLYAVSQNSLFNSENGMTWDRTPNSPALVLLASARRTAAMVGVSTEGKLLQSLDTGRTWRVLSMQSPKGITGIAIVDQDKFRVVASTDDEGVLVSQLDGTWRSANGFVNGALPTVHARAIHYEPESGDRYVSASGEFFEGALYVATDVGIFKSVDAMQTWMRLRLTADVVAITGSAAAPRTLFAVARDGSVYRSDDAGTSWS